MQGLSPPCPVPSGAGQGFNHMPSRVPSYRKPSLPRPAAEQTKKQQNPFYSRRAWRGSENRKGVRELQLEAEPLCRVCKEQGRLTEATQVHHVVKVKDDEELALDMGNLWSVCKPCHDMLSRQGK